jgi:carbon monoxide dehydrogenase subunit G
MAKYSGTVDAPHSAEAVWSYLADLRSVGEWDPSVERVRLTAGEPRTDTARYELEVSFRGRTISLPYRVVEVDPPLRVVFEAETEAVSVHDEARIEPVGDGSSRVTWAADLQLKGARRIFELPLRAAFGKLGEDAKRGLAERLSEPALDAPGDRIAA